MFIYVCKILCQSCLSATITMLVLVLQWVLEYLYLINIQSVQSVHHSPSVLSLLLYLPSLVAYHPTYTRLGSLQGYTCLPSDLLFCLYCLVRIRD